ncbi:MAG: metalloregulator ArsR/SmtB family transcription factor [Polyangiaceae bacterium]
MVTKSMTKLEKHAAQLAALGSPVRLAIVRHVVQGDAEGTSVGELQAQLDIPWSTLSHHVERLTSAGLLSQRRDGKFLFCRAEYASLRALTDYLWEDCCKGGTVKSAKSCC